MLMLRPSAIICADGGDALGRGRDLHEQVGLGDALVELAGRVDGAVGVAGEVGRELDRHEAVAAAALVVDRAQDVERVLDVVDHQVPVRVVDRLVPLRSAPRTARRSRRRPAIAFWKIVGFDVMPRMPRVDQRCELAAR